MNTPLHIWVIRVILLTPLFTAAVPSTLQLIESGVMISTYALTMFMGIIFLMMTVYMLEENKDSHTSKMTFVVGVGMVLGGSLSYSGMISAVILTALAVAFVATTKVNPGTMISE
jgi:hypothetical protein